MTWNPARPTWDDPFSNIGYWDRQWGYRIVYKDVEVNRLKAIPEWLFVETFGR
jgi:hypothetical protein